MTLLDNPHFLILKDKEHFIFYNTIRHYACRISELDLVLFNLFYTYKDLRLVLSQLDKKYHQYVKGVYTAVIDNKVLSNTPVMTCDTIGKVYPLSYYLHLTYKCNLKCTYCYNRKIRSKFVEMTKKEWNLILDRISLYAKNIIITGGEPSLTPLLPYIITQIRKKKKNIHIEIISNCMTDFSTYKYADEVFSNIDRATFSCDNLSDVGQTRINFNPSLFRKNIDFLRKRYKDLSMTITSVFSKCNLSEFNRIKEYCSCQSVNFRNVLIVPNGVSELSLLPTLEDYCSTFSSFTQPLDSLRLYCGAGIGVLSVDPLGNVYPCQSLHYKKYKMGNLLTDSIEDIINTQIHKDIAKEFSIDNIPTCKDCKVKYICCGGCRAATLNIEGKPTEYPKTLCRYYKEKAINMLRSIPK